MSKFHPTSTTDYKQLITHDVEIFADSTEGNVGIFSPFSMRFATDLRSAGVDVDFDHEPENREVRQGLFAEVAYQLAIGFGSSVAATAAWEAVVLAFRRATKGERSTDPVNVHLSRQRKLSDGTTETLWLDYEGPINGLPEALVEFTWPDAKRLN